MYIYLSISMYETKVCSPKLSRYIIFYAHNKIPTMQENKESDIQTYKLKIFTNLLFHLFTKNSRERNSFDQSLSDELHRKRVPISSGIGGEKGRKKEETRVKSRWSEVTRNKFRRNGTWRRRRRKETSLTA